MLHWPSLIVRLLPPWARTIPAARLLAPWPARHCSSTTTFFAPCRRANQEAQPPTVPAPTTTRSATALFATRAPWRSGEAECSPQRTSRKSDRSDLEWFHADGTSGARERGAAPGADPARRAADRPVALAPRERGVRDREPPLRSGEGRDGRRLSAGGPRDAAPRHRVRLGAGLARRLPRPTQRRGRAGDRPRARPAARRHRSRRRPRDRRRRRRDPDLPRGRGARREPLRDPSPARALVDGPRADPRRGPDGAPRGGHRRRLSDHAPAPDRMDAGRSPRGERDAARLLPPVSGLGRVPRQSPARAL